MSMEKHPQAGDEVPDIKTKRKIGSASDHFTEGAQQIATTGSFVACENCALDAVCSPIKIGGHSVSLVHNLMGRREPVNRGEFLFHKGDSMVGLYAVTSGTIKLVQATDTGREQVLGFRFPGELFGEEAIFTRQYNLSAVAVDDASVCRIPMAELEESANNIPSLQRDLLDLISRQCYLMYQQVGAYVARNSAEVRLSAFLSNIFERTSTHTGSQAELSLALSRDDIANYLGLRRETLSRTLTKLQKVGVILVKGKTITILNTEQLRLLAQF